MTSVAGIFLRAGLLVIGVQVAFWAWDHGAETVEDLAKHKDRLILPGPLLAAHDREIGDDCHACHGDGLRRVDRSRCLSCHEEVGRRIAEGIGHHGTLTGDCEDCHVEHRGAEADLIQFDAAKFNHALTLFPLTGAHVAVTCDRCHLQQDEDLTFAEARRFLGVPFGSCADCHRDPHEGQLEARCDQCHHADGFHAPHVQFDHDVQSRFALATLHANLDCSSCHASKRYRDAEESCEDCHSGVRDILAGRGLVASEPDPHFGQVACTQCHSPDEPHGAPQRHAERCSSCHNEHYGSMFFARMNLISRDLRRLVEEGRIDASEKAWTETAVYHNYEAARLFVESKR